jgi:hypothetical protein
LASSEAELLAGLSLEVTKRLCTQLGLSALRAEWDSVRESARWVMQEALAEPPRAESPLLESGTRPVLLEEFLQHTKRSLSLQSFILLSNWCREFGGPSRSQPDAEWYWHDALARTVHDPDERLRFGAAVGADAGRIADLASKRVMQRTREVEKAIRTSGNRISERFADEWDRRMVRLYDEGVGRRSVVSPLAHLAVVAINVGVASFWAELIFEEGGDAPERVFRWYCDYAESHGVPVSARVRPRTWREDRVSEQVQPADER